MVHLDVAKSNEATADAMFVDDMLLECANGCLRQALQAGRSSEVPFFKKALERAASSKLDRLGKDAQDREHHPGQSFSVAA